VFFPLSSDHSILWLHRLVHTKSFGLFFLVAFEEYLDLSLDLFESFGRRFGWGLVCHIQPTTTGRANVPSEEYWLIPVIPAWKSKSKTLPKKYSQSTVADETTVGNSSGSVP
jgi:hypothetical protein